MCGVPLKIRHSIYILEQWALKVEKTLKGQALSNFGLIY